MRSALLPVVCLLFTACVPSPYRIGVKAAKEGRYIDATTAWIGALDEDVYASKPRKALRENAKLAWDQRLDLAREHEASRRYESSVRTYREMLDYASALDDLELLAFSTADASMELEDVLDTWAMSERATGTIAHEEGRWQDAAEAFDRARALRPGLSGLDAEQGATYAAWAREDVERHRYHDAADHFRRAFALTGSVELDAWTAAVEAGLGRYSLENGACRAAVEHFRLAGDVVGDPSLDAARREAADCARLGLLMDPVEANLRVGDGSLDVGAMLLDRVERDVQTTGTSFVRILASELLSTLEDPPDHQVRVAIKVTQASVGEPQTTVEKQVVEGSRVVDCDQETALYAPDSVCTDEVQVEYQFHRTAQTARLAGAVRIVDLGSGEQSTRPLDITLTHDTTHATDFRMFEAGTTVPIHIGTEAVVGRIEVPEAIVALSGPPLPLPVADEMLVDAIHALASEAARSILEVVDREEALPPPRRLALVRPMVAPTDVDFRVVAPEEALVEPSVETEAPAPAPTEEEPMGLENAEDPQVETPESVDP